MSTLGRWAIVAFLTSGAASASVDVSEERTATRVTAMVGANGADPRGDALDRSARVSPIPASRRSHATGAAMARPQGTAPGCAVRTEPISLRPTSTDGIERVQGTASVTLRCRAGTAYAIAAGRGAHYDRGRRMLDAETGAYIEYELFLDPDHAVRWDEDHALRGVSDGRDARVTVFARAEEPMREGSYADDVDVIVEY